MFLAAGKLGGRPGIRRHAPDRLAWVSVAIQGNDMRKYVARTICASACCMFASGVVGQQLDPVFGNSFESGLIGFGPPLTIVAAPSSDVQTANTPLVVTLSDPAGAPTFVPVTSSDPTHLTITGGGTTVNAGQTTANVRVSGLIGSTTPVTLWAHFGNTLGASVLVQATLNETDVSAEADFCNVQSPTAFSVPAGTPAPTVFGQLFEAGVTEPVGPPMGWIAQFGYGVQGSDPRLLDGWQFLDATYNAQVSNNDEFKVDFTAPLMADTYAYTYRFSNDGGASWTYCDTDGAGSNMGATFSPGALGTMTSISPAAGLVINEVDYDQVGTDLAEFVEVYNSSAGAIDLSTLALVFINGSNSVEYLRVSLASAGSIAPGQYLVVKTAAVPTPPLALTILFPGSMDQIQNGAPDGIVLFDTATGSRIDSLSYEGSITHAQISGFSGTYNLVEGTVLSSSVADNNSVSASLVRLPNGSDTNDAATDWTLSTTPTPGTANTP